MSVSVFLCVLTHVGRPGRLSESRADCQKVGQTVRESSRLIESRQHCQRNGSRYLKSTGGQPFLKIDRATHRGSIPGSGESGQMVR